MKRLLILTLLVHGWCAFSANECTDYLLQEGGQPIGVRRIESMWGMPVEVVDVSQFLRERTTAAMHGLKAFRLADVFAKPTFFLGFGRPNVYQAIPVEGAPDDDVMIYAAKSLRRAPSELKDSRGWAQSGVLAVPRNLPPEAIGRLMAAAKARVGSRSWTCVNDNCKVLSDAGFTVGGESPSQYYFPMPFLQDLLRYGLEYKGEAVEFDLVRTTTGYLDDVRGSISKAVALTPCRHADRSCGQSAFVVGVKRLGRWTGSFFFSTKTVIEPLEEMVVRLPSSDDFRTFDVAVSEPSTLGTWLRTLWGPHAMFEVPLELETVNRFLPTVMKAFPQEKPSLFTRLKKNLLFSKPVVDFARSQLASRYRHFQAMSEKHLYDMLRTNSELLPNKYNLVVTGTKAILTKNNIRMGMVDWILSKHVFVSGYSDDVRFAGEVWKGLDGKIYVSRNSGTYRPTDAQLQAVVEMLKLVFPNVPIVIAADAV